MDNTVSVIIYCRNDVDKIARTIRSVLDQNYHNKNIVIIDDGSTDDSWSEICKTLNRMDKVEDFELTQTYNNTFCYAKQNEFDDGILRALYDGSTKFWKASDWFGVTSGPYLAGKINVCMGEADENIGYIYTDYILGGFKMFEQSNMPSRIDTGFFNKSCLEKIDVCKIKDEAHFLDIIKNNFLTHHIPEGLQTIA